MKNTEIFIQLSRLSYIKRNKMTIKNLKNIDIIIIAKYSKKENVQMMIMICITLTNF